MFSISVTSPFELCQRKKKVTLYTLSGYSVAPLYRSGLRDLIIHNLSGPRRRLVSNLGVDHMAVYMAINAKLFPLCATAERPTWQWTGVEWSVVGRSASFLPFPLDSCAGPGNYFR